MAALTTIPGRADLKLLVAAMTFTSGAVRLRVLCLTSDIMEVRGELSWSRGVRARTGTLNA